MQLPEHKRPQRRSSQELMSRAPEQEKRLFSVEEDVDPYWDKMVDAAMAHTLSSTEVFKIVSQLLRIHPDRRGSFEPFINDDQWSTHKERLSHLVFQYKNAVDSSESINKSLMGIADILLVFPYRRTELEDMVDMHQIGDTCDVYIQKLLKEHDWNWLPQVLETYLILFPERQKALIEEVRKIFYKDSTDPDPEVDFSFEEWVRRKGRYELRIMGSFVPSIKSLTVFQQKFQKMKEYMQELREQGNWYTYSSCVVAGMTLSADRVEIDKQGIHLRFDEAMEQHTALPQRSIV